MNDRIGGTTARQVAAIALLGSILGILSSVAIRAVFGLRGTELLVLGPAIGSFLAAAIVTPFVVAAEAKKR